MSPEPGTVFPYLVKGTLKIWLSTGSWDDHGFPRWVPLITSILVRRRQEGWRGDVWAEAEAIVMPLLEGSVSHGAQAASGSRSEKEKDPPLGSPGGTQSADNFDVSLSHPLRTPDFSTFT